MLRVLALAATETIVLVDRKYSGIVILLGGFTRPSEHLQLPHMLLKEVQALFCAMLKHCMYSDSNACVVTAVTTRT